MMSASNSIDWTNYVKLLNEHDKKVEAAMCTKCKKIIQNFNNDLLNEHRKTCKRKISEKTEQNHKKRKIEGQTDTTDDDQVDVDSADLSKKDMNKLLNKLLVELFVVCNIPFRVIESEHFKNFVKALCNVTYQFKLPCRQTLASSLVNSVYHDIIEKRKSLLSNTSSVLTVDSWKNKSINRQFLIFTVRNIHTCQTFLKFTEVSINKNDAESLAKAIKDAITTAKETFETDIYAIVTDNDDNIKTGGTLAESCDNEPLWQTTCSIDSGNLFSKSLINSSFVEIIHEIISAFRAPKIESLLIKQGGSKLTNYTDARFWFFKDACQSIINNLQILQQISTTKAVSLSENVINVLHNDNFESQLTEAIEILQPVCDLITKSQDPNCNVADAAQMWISLASLNIYDVEALNSQIEKTLWPIAYAANILHPEYQGTLLDEDQRNLAFDFFFNHLTEETLKELEKFLNNIEESVQVLRQRCKNPITFWGLCDVFYPHLSEVALKLFLIPAATAQMDILFSNWGYVRNSLRNRLSIDKSGQLIDIYYTSCAIQQTVNA